mgnify:CR=1 FL=1
MTSRDDPERELLEWSAAREGKPRGYVSTLEKAIKDCADGLSKLYSMMDQHERKDERRHAEVMRALGQHDAQIQSTRNSLDDEITGVTDVEELQGRARGQRERAQKMKRAAVISAVVTVVGSVLAILRETGVLK